jgi:uncharacterized protein (DUF736 family)
MIDHDNTNAGALFKNDNKESEKHPDYRGTLNCEGTEFWLSAWIKTSKKGAKCMSLSIKPKNADHARPKQNIRDDLRDQVPF